MTAVSGSGKVRGVDDVSLLGNVQNGSYNGRSVRHGEKPKPVKFYGSPSDSNDSVDKDSAYESEPPLSQTPSISRSSSVCEVDESEPLLSQTPSISRSSSMCEVGMDDVNQDEVGGKITVREMPLPRAKRFFVIRFFRWLFSPLLKSRQYNRLCQNLGVDPKLFTEDEKKECKKILSEGIDDFERLMPGFLERVRFRLGCYELFDVESLYLTEEVSGKCKEILSRDVRDFDDLRSLRLTLEELVKRRSGYYTHLGIEEKQILYEELERSYEIFSEEDLDTLATSLSGKLKSCSEYFARSQLGIDPKSLDNEELQTYAKILSGKTKDLEKLMPDFPKLIYCKRVCQELGVDPRSFNEGESAKYIEIFSRDVGGGFPDSMRAFLEKVKLRLDYYKMFDIKPKDLEKFNTFFQKAFFSPCIESPVNDACFELFKDIYDLLDLFSKEASFKGQLDVLSKLGKDIKTNEQKRAFEIYFRMHLAGILQACDFLNLLVTIPRAKGTFFGIEEMKTADERTLKENDIPFLLKKLEEDPNYNLDNLKKDDKELAGRFEKWKPSLAFLDQLAGQYLSCFTKKEEVEKEEAYKYSREITAIRGTALQALMLNEDLTEDNRQELLNLLRVLEKERESGEEVVSFEFDSLVRTYNLFFEVCRYSGRPSVEQFSCPETFSEREDCIKVLEDFVFPYGNGYFKNLKERIQMFLSDENADIRGSADSFTSESNHLFRMLYILNLKYQMERDPKKVWLFETVSDALGLS